MSKQPIPYIATHPGEILRDELKARNINQTEFSSLIGKKNTWLNEIIKGKRPVTADTAILLDKALDIPAIYWMNLQSQFEIDQALIDEKNQISLQNIELWNSISQYVPIKIFKKLGFFSGKLDDDIEATKDIYNIKSINDLQPRYNEIKSCANYRKSSSFKVNEVNLFGWSSLLVWQARKIKVAEYNPDRVDLLIKELQQAFYENKNLIEKTKAILAKYGIIMVIREKLDQTPVDGISFWSENNPVIGLSLRYHRLDNLAFTIFHELGHIKLHLLKDKNIQFIDIYDMASKDTSQKEEEANSFAENCLLPSELWEEIKNEVPYTTPIIIGFAKKHKIHPAIVRGRICWENKRFNILTDIDYTIN